MLLGVLSILNTSLRMPFRGFLFRNPTSLHVIFWSRTSKNSFLQSCYRHLMNFILSCSAKNRFKSWNWKLTYAKSVAKFGAKFLSFLLNFVTFGHWKIPVLIYLTDFKKKLYILQYVHNILQYNNWQYWLLFSEILFHFYSHGFHSISKKL